MKRGEFIQVTSAAIAGAAIFPGALATKNHQKAQLLTKVERIMLLRTEHLGAEIHKKDGTVTGLNPPPLSGEFYEMYRRLKYEVG